MILFEIWDIMKKSKLYTYGQMNWSDEKWGYIIRIFYMKSTHLKEY